MKRDAIVWIHCGMNFCSVSLFAGNQQENSNFVCLTAIPTNQQAFPPPTKLKTYKAQLKRPKLNSSQSFPGRDSSLFPTENNHFCGKIHENRKILCSISKVQKLHNMQVKLIPIGSKYPKSSYPALSKLKVGKGCSWASKPVTSTCAVRSHLGRWLQNHAASKFFRTLNTWIILFK